MTYQIEINTPRLLLKSITPAIIHELFNTRNNNPMVKNIKLFITILSTILFLNESKACICNDIQTIDSLPQLSNYDFIAHVYILEDKFYKYNEIGSIGNLTIKIIELFKGTDLKEILEYDKGTSCDIGLNKDEEWILFGKYIDGKISIMSCDRNKRYKEKNELRDWKYQYGFYEIKQLRKLFNHPIPKFKNKKRIEFYRTGQKEIEENYTNGLLNGERQIWYPNGNLFCKQYYKQDTLIGKSEWFYPSGQIYDEDYYFNGKPCNVSRLYFDSAINESWKEWLIQDYYKTEANLKFVYYRVQPQYESIYDSYGRTIIYREYTRLGKIDHEEIIDPDKDFTTLIYYHENGIISSIMYNLKGNNYGHYQEYDENGLPDRSWNYDENGKAID